MTGTPDETNDDSMRVTVRRDGPYIVTGGVPLTGEEICEDELGYALEWRETARFPTRRQYALCRCGQSRNKPFCDGAHAAAGFDGTETAGDEPYLRRPRMTGGPALELADYENLCAHARFCMRAGGIWGLTEQSADPEARDTAVEEGCNCPAGRLVLRSRATGREIEPELERSIAVVECPAKGEHGPLWVRGSIPVVSADGRSYRVRNRVTLCRCGRSRNKPFCDGSHVKQ
jgi:CDGSH-type Zn-finger protein